MSEVKEHWLTKIALDAKCIDELICKLASGKAEWSMSIPPQDFDTDMMLIRPVREYIPELTGFVKNLQQENQKLKEALEVAVDCLEYFVARAEGRHPDGYIISLTTYGKFKEALSKLKSLGIVKEGE